MFRRWMTLLCAMLALMTSVAQGQATGGATPPDLQAMVAGYLDEQTMLVAHLNVNQVDTAAVETYVGGLLDAAQAPPESRQQLAAARAAADVFLTRFKQVGGRHVFLLLSHPDIWPDRQPLAILIPLENGGDAEAMKALLSATVPGITVQSVKPGLVFAGHEAAYRRLASLKPAPRPDLALRIVNGAALNAVAALTADQRRALHELLPSFPREIGGESTEVLTRDIEGLNLHVALPPNLSATLVLRERSETAPPGQQSPTGRQVAAMLTEMRDMILESRELADALGGEGFNAGELKPVGDEIRNLIRAALTPLRAVYGPSGGINVAGWEEQMGPGDFGHNALQLRGTQVQTLVRALGPPLARARQGAERTVSATNIKQILVALIVHADDNADTLPESLHVLVAGGKLQAQVLHNPADPKRREYVYRRWIAQYSKIPSPATMPLVWEEVDDPNSPVNVGFADGHVEFFVNRADLDELLRKAQESKARIEALP